MRTVRDASANRVRLAEGQNARRVSGGSTGGRPPSCRDESPRHGSTSSGGRGCLGHHPQRRNDHPRQHPVHSGAFLFSHYVPAKKHYSAVRKRLRSQWYRSLRDAYASADVHSYYRSYGNAASGAESSRWLCCINSRTCQRPTAWRPFVRGASHRTPRRTTKAFRERNARHPCLPTYSVKHHIPYEACSIERQCHPHGVSFTPWKTPQRRPASQGPQR